MQSPSDERITDRQERIAGSDQERFSRAHVGLIGAGGINGEVGELLCRKGIGALTFVDQDTFCSTNANRQLCFIPRDERKPKAHRIIHNLAPHCINSTELTGWNVRVQQLIEWGFPLGCNAWACGVDNGRTRITTDIYMRALGRPGIHMGVSPTAEAGYVFVEESTPASPCFACAFPLNYDAELTRCISAASKDILKAVAAFAGYALDTILQNRKRCWNYREIHLAGFMPDECRTVQKNSNCPLCGTPERYFRNLNSIAV
jgi:molybdopterin/thiamine biosynthesis adenylyltransferase